MGWLEKLSAKAACSSNSFSVQPLAGLTWLTAKTPLGQGAGFIKHSNGGVGKCFQIVTALDEDAAAGSAADAAEEAQRNADDQRAGTADNQEGERTADPGQPAAAQHQRW